MYQDKHKYNVIKGVIPDFGYDVKVAIEVDNNKQKNIPERKASNNNYYSVNVTCSNNTQGEWDYNAWNLKIDSITSDSKCNIVFTSNLSEADYKEYIEAGIEYRRNTYRGKNITDLKTSGALYTQISNCTFDDIYVGDYIKGNNNVTWLIADLNNYLHTGSTELIKCHATIIPAGSLETGRMNSTNTTGVVNSVTVGMIGYGRAGYLGSEMKNIVLPKILKKYIEPDFNGHIITYHNLLSNAMNDTLSNQYGSDGGASSSWEWVNSQIDLMSEVNVSGSIVWSSSGYDVGIDNRQYAIFKLRPDLINTDLQGSRYWYWLKAVASSTAFAIVGANGDASDPIGSSNAGGIRPRFLID